MTEEAHRELFIVQGTSLADVGLAGHYAAEAVDPAGDRLFLIACRALINDALLPPADVEHEQLGVLDWRMRERIRLAPLRCSRPTRSGRPCRTVVTSPGARCRCHR